MSKPTIEELRNIQAGWENKAAGVYDAAFHLANGYVPDQEMTYNDFVHCFAERVLDCEKDQILQALDRLLDDEKVLLLIALAERINEYRNEVFTKPLLAALQSKGGEA